MVYETNKKIEVISVVTLKRNSRDGVEAVTPKDLAMLMKEGLGDVPVKIATLNPDYVFVEASTETVP